ncbi:MAG: SDR family oxidoreductase [Lachnospiraceae bacterium]|nr:SDR family oxidoreductase [Lachnospiraceae bacterium]
MVDVKGRWALVTGGARGIGRLVSLFLAERGCNIIVQSRKKEHADKVKAEVEELGAQCIAVEAELSDLESVKKMLEEVDGLGHRIDIVMNNAGMQIAYRTEWLTTPAEDYTDSFLINTVAPMMICYHFIPKMTEAGFGRIVNTTSGIALEPEQAGYSAAKAALNKVTIDIGSKLQGTDVMINLTDPGWCRTDLGGPNAPNAPESAIPGVVVGAFVDDGKSGRIFGAGLFYDMTLEQAVAAAHNMNSPY